MGGEDQAKSKAQLVAELRALRARLRELEQRAPHSAEAAEELEHLYELALDLMVVLDFQGRYIRVNPACERILGYSIAELVGRRCFELIHPEDRPAAQQSLRQLTAGNPVEWFVDRMLHKDGSIRWIAWTLVSLPERQVIFGIGRDVTEQRRAEQALRENEERFRDLVENINDVIYTIDADGTIRYVSPAIERLFGYTPEELIGQPLTTPFHPDEHERIWQNVPRLLAGQPVANEYRMVTKSGEIRWARTSSRPRYREGRIVGIQGVLSDVTKLKQAEEILQRSYNELERRVEQRNAELATASRSLREEATERQRAEQALRESASLQRAMLENMPLDFWACDTDCRCFLQSSESIANWGDMQGKRLADQPSDQHVCRYWVARCRQALAGQRARGEIAATTRDGKQRYFLNIVAPIVLEGQVCGVLGINVDLTEQKQNEQALLQEQERLRRLIELQEHQRKLIAYEIHDGFVQEATGALLFLEGLPEDVDLRVNHARQRLNVAVEALRRGIAEARYVINGLRPAQLEELGPVAALEHHLAQLQEQSDVRIDFTYQVRFNRLASELETAIFRIVQEAVNNALRHSNSQTIQVALTEEDGVLVIEVVDHGVGFDPQQVAPEHYGLEGIRQRARLLGGKAEIQSAPGQGTRVIVQLPLKGAEVPPPANN